MSGAWLRSPIETIVALGRSRGFVFPSGEIYGGERSAWDFGPLGVELKNNVKRQWWKAVVTAREDVVGMDSAVVLPRETWFASGHADAFTAPLVECTSCSKRFDADRLTEDRRGPDPDDPDDLDDIACPHCGTRGRWTEPRPSPLLMLTGVGPIECDEGLHHLRPETVQGAFLNFLNVQTTSRIAPPFGIGQIGRSFRNEIATGTFLFRSREFEQMELAYFVEPGSDEELHQYWIDERTSWYADLGIARDNLRHRERPKERLAHYAKRSVDIEYRYGFSGQEWGEVEGVANRTDADMLAHSNRSGVELSFYDRASATRWTPYVIGPSAGVERAVMAFLLEACVEDEVPNAVGGTDHRVVLRLDPRLAPVKAAVLPLSRNADLTPAARDLAAALRRNWNVEFDDAGALGRRYRRQDEIGTPFCVTVDFDSLADHAVTVRERDSLATERVGIDRVESYLATRLVGC